MAKGTKSTNKLGTPTDLSGNATPEIAAGLNRLAADSFALYLKTKNFHWHVSGAHFRDYHLLFDEQAGQILGAIDQLAERARKIGEATLHSVAEVARLKTVADNDKSFVPAAEMLKELMADNQKMAKAMRQVHETASGHNDVATASILENLIDEAEKRTWFLFEAGRKDS